ncbi:MAG: hypothetical protein ACO2PN_16425 [Pyrobaculum sp.]|jgi:hypothetical protein
MQNACAQVTPREVVATIKPGERIAVSYMPIAKIDNGVAVLSKARPKIRGICGRREVVVTMPFFVRGGFRVMRVEVYKIPREYMCIRYYSKTASVKEWSAERCLPERDIYIHELPDVNKLAEVLINHYIAVDVTRYEITKLQNSVERADAYVRQFKHLTVIYPLNDYFWYYWWSGYVKAPFYTVYEFVNENEAKLIDDVSRIDYVAMFTHYGLESKHACASIKIFGDGVIWSDSNTACCRRESTAIGAVVAKYGTKVYIAKRDIRRYEIEEWVMTFPPKKISTYYADKTESVDVPEHEIV